MRDEIEGRLWVANHDQFSDSVASFLARLADGYRRLQAIQFAAPWARASRPPEA